ncbi:MAG: GAF domain-containing protein [Planctomycetes bacterium]|nr:GAF domain-containing protein [Planctomycetota bacterium]
MADPPGASQLSLVFNARGRSVVYPLPPGPTSLGSAADNDLVLEGEGVQPHHAVVSLEADGLVLRDLFAGATAINDEPRTSGPLRAGDVLTLGRLRLRVLRVATTSRRTRRPDPKDDTTKRASRHGLTEEPRGAGSSGEFRRPSSRRITSTSVRPLDPLASGPQRRPSDPATSGTRRRPTEPVSGARRRPSDPATSGGHRRSTEPHTSGRRRRPSGEGAIPGESPLSASGTRRRSARTSSDWLGELNGDPEETQGVGIRARSSAAVNPQVEELEERVKQLSARLRNAETRARSAQERLKHLEQVLAEREAGGEGDQDHLDLASLHELCTSMVDEPDLERVLELITESLLETFSADRAVLILTEEDGRNPLINVERVRGRSAAESEETGVAPEILEQTLHTRRVLEVNGEEDGFGGLSAPILRSGRTFGILYFERTEAGGPPIGRSDTQLMSVFATLACLVIQPLMSEELT